MDKLVRNAYLTCMFARLVTILAILAITVVPAVTSAHAARMDVAPDHAVHASEMMHSSHNSELSCDGGKHCGSADFGMCEMVCAGLSVFLTSPGGEAGRDCGPASHDQPSATTLASRAPALNERPPKLRLL